MTAETPIKQLSPDEWDITNTVEQCYYLDGGIPSIDRINQITGISKGFIEKTLYKPVVAESLALRGINLSASGELLSTEQLAALALFFDTKDGRSFKKKLSDIGITTQQWDAWKKNPAFSSHMRQRAEGALQSNIAETEVALMDSAQRGDISAIKLHLELAGRWSSKTVGELNVEFLLIKILEAVQKHVQNLPGGQEAVENIANELLTLTPNPNLNPPTNQPALISGGVDQDTTFPL